MQKIMLICGASSTVINFRRGLIGALKSNGFDVAVVALDDEYRNEIEKLDIKFYVCDESKNRDTSPLRILKLKRHYVDLIREYNPDVVFTFMTKPNTFGVFAAKKVGVKKIYSMVEGAGDVFINRSFKWNIIRRVVCFLFKKSFKNCEKIFFLNKNDKADFLKRKLVCEEKCEEIHGIGVDLDKFAYIPVKHGDISFLMVARMLKTKGVTEYCECARRIKKIYPDVKFGYLGEEGTLKLADIKEYIDDKSVEYYGVTKDVRPYLEKCSVFVLPSYREGCPMSVMEAEATGRAVIVTDTVGCNETVTDKENGLKVKVGSSDDLFEKAKYLIENSELIEKMGKKSREFAENNFDQRKINARIIGIIK